MALNMAYIENGSDSRKWVCENDLPNIFLIGDSIRKGYCNTTVEAMAGKAHVIFPDDNCRNSQYILTRLRAWSQEYDGEHMDVVQFNCGQWDCAHFNGDPDPLTEVDAYGKNIKRIVMNIRKLFPKAKLIFATTTPINPIQPEAVNPRTTADVRRYNAAALTALEGEDIPVNDLFAVAENWDESYYKDLCHLQPEGYEKLGLATAKFLQRFL